MSYVIIAYSILYLLPAIIVDILQIRHIQLYAKKEPVILNTDDYLIAANYALTQRKISFFSHIYDFIIMVFWLQYGILYLTQLYSQHFTNTFGVDWCVLMSFLGINFVIGLPFSIVQKRIDAIYGFNKQNFTSLLSDFLKGIIIGIIIAAVIFASLLFVMESISLWWLVGFILIFCFIILIQLIYPTIIAPMFNKFTPLQDEKLKNRIQDLMEKVGFKSNGIFIMDASKRDGRLNAYFGGLGNSKRVVLFDTLLEKISEDGLIAILGHELGHFKHKDILCNIVIAGSIMFIVFAIMGLFFESLCEYLGLYESHGTILILAMLFLPALTFIIKPIQNYFSRKAEYKADAFGASCVSKKALSQALIRLVNENKAFPHSHPAFIFFYYSHPPLLERLKALENLND